MRDLLKNTFRFFLEIPECFYNLTALERSLFFLDMCFFPLLSRDLRALAL